MVLFGLKFAASERFSLCWESARRIHAKSGRNCRRGVRPISRGISVIYCRGTRAPRLLPLKNVCVCPQEGFGPFLLAGVPNRGRISWVFAVRSIFSFVSSAKLPESNTAISYHQREKCSDVINICFIVNLICVVIVIIIYSGTFF